MAGRESVSGHLGARGGAEEVDSTPPDFPNPFEESPTSGRKPAKRKTPTETALGVSDEEGHESLAPKPKKPKTESIAPEVRTRPMRERKQPTHLLASDFLDESAFASLESRSLLIEHRRAAFYDSKSYTGEVTIDLIPDRMSMQDKDAFPKYAKHPNLTSTFLVHRNSIISMWQANAPAYLSFSTYISSLQSPEHEFAPGEYHFLQRLWKYLHVNRRINPGSEYSEPFEVHSPDPSDDELGDAPVKAKRGSRSQAKKIADTNRTSPEASAGVDRDAPRKKVKRSSAEGGYKAHVGNGNGNSSMAATGGHADGSGARAGSSSALLGSAAAGGGSSSKFVKLKVVKSREKDDSVGESESEAPLEDEEAIALEALAFASAAASSTGGLNSITTSPRAALEAHDGTYDVFDHPSAGTPHDGLHASQAPKRKRHPTNTSKKSLDTPSSSMDPVLLQDLDSTAPSKRKRARSTPVQPEPKPRASENQLKSSTPPSSITSNPSSGPLLARNPCPTTVSNLRVCIVGAGIAGLSAAQLLHQHGVKNVKVLESRLRLGGRVLSAYVNSTCIELGAQFVQEDYNNPISDLLSQLRLHVALFQPSTASPDTQAMFVEPHPLAAESRAALASDHDHSDEDSDTANGMTPAEKEDTNIWPSLIFHGVPSDMVSQLEATATHLYSDKLATVTQGIGEVIRNLALGIDVRLGCKVESLHYSTEYRADTVMVQYSDSMGISRSETFDIVLVTAPLGTLQAGKIKFDPPLPFSKATAIQRLQVGYQSKLFLVFEKVFWDTSAGSSDLVVLYKDDHRGTIAYSSPSWYGSRAIVQVLICGHSSVLTDDMQDDEAVAVSMVNLLKEKYGKNLPRLLSYVYCPWSRDPHSLGAFSYAPSGEAPALRKLVAGPIHMGRIGFAGEHTHALHPSSIHGAYESGIREARRILDLFTEKHTGQLAHPFHIPTSYLVRNDLPFAHLTPAMEAAHQQVLESLPRANIKISSLDQLQATISKTR